MLRLVLLAFLFVLSTASFVAGQPILPRKYTIPASQDSVWEAPSAIDPAVRETDPGRFALPHRELMQRTYDVSGQKSEWILGTSILGNPDLDPYALGIVGISQRYPSKLSGLYTTRLGYDASTITLNGENGLMVEERHGIPVDTPITDLAWERGAFEGNALRLDFRRIITDSVMLDLGLQSRSNKLSKEYSYQNVTHSPYFALGRDSSSIPFAGRNIGVNSMHFQPLLTYRFGFGKIFLKMNYLSLENADNTSHMVLLDSLDHSIREFQVSPYRISIEARSYGAGFELYPTRKLTFGASVMYGTHEIIVDSTGGIFKEVVERPDTLTLIDRDSIFFRKDSVYYDTTKAYTYETILGDFKLGYETLLNPTLKFQYEFLDTDEELKDYSRIYRQDREIGYLELSDTLGILQFRLQGGMQRNSSIKDEEELKQAYSADVAFSLPFHFRLDGSLRHDNKFPDASQMKFTELGRIAYPNENLKTEIRERRTANLGWYSREVYYGLGIRYERAENLMKPKWVMGHGMESFDQAFQWSNIPYVRTTDWLFQVGFRLGNWKFFLERGQTLDRDYDLIDVAELYYKGSIHWQNRFVKERMGVSVRVDWQWFDHRYDCGLNESGLPELQLMKHYLALDFEARMQILSFELYNRIENFNHSIYMPAVGYTPEGLRFSYGIVWTFRN